MSTPDHEPITAASIARHLATLSRQLEDLTEQTNQAEIDAVNLREDHTAARSKAFLAAEGAMDMRNHQSIVETSETRLAAELAEAHVKGLRRRIDTVRIRVDIGRSYGAALRAETGLAGTGATP